jgi:hypothetical protein
LMSADQVYGVPGRPRARPGPVSLPPITRSASSSLRQASQSPSPHSIVGGTPKTPGLSVASSKGYSVSSGDASASPTQRSPLHTELAPLQLTPSQKELAPLQKELKGRIGEGLSRRRSGVQLTATIPQSDDEASLNLSPPSAKSSPSPSFIRRRASTGTAASLSPNALSSPPLPSVGGAGGGLRVVAMAVVSSGRLARLGSDASRCWGVDDPLSVEIVRCSFSIFPSTRNLPYHTLQNIARRVDIRLHG